MIQQTETTMHNMWAIDENQFDYSISMKNDEWCSVKIFDSVNNQGTKMNIRWDINYLQSNHATYSAHFDRFWAEHIRTMAYSFSWPVLNFSMFSDWGKNMLEKYLHIWEETILIKPWIVFWYMCITNLSRKWVLKLTLLEAIIHFRAQFRQRHHIDS